MESITINKNNWSGETATVQISRKRMRFNFDGETYKIKHGPAVNKIQPVEILDEDNQTVASGMKFIDDEVYSFQAYGCERSSKCPFTAAIQLFFNIM